MGVIGGGGGGGGGVDDGVGVGGKDGGGGGDGDGGGGVEGSVGVLGTEVSVEARDSLCVMEEAEVVLVRSGWGTDAADVGVVDTMGRGVADVVDMATDVARRVWAFESIVDTAGR